MLTEGQQKATILADTVVNSPTGCSRETVVKRETGHSPECSSRSTQPPPLAEGYKMATTRFAVAGGRREEDMAITIRERGKSPVTIDREGELEIMERAFEGLEHVVLQTPGLNDRTDGIVALPDLSHFVVEVKDRNYDYAYISQRGPLVDTGKAVAVAERAADQGGRGIIIWRSSDGFLIGADAEDIIAYGDVNPTYQRLRGNRPQDKPKSASVLPMEYCYVRPPAKYPAGRLEQSWLRWLSSAEPERAE